MMMGMRIIIVLRILLLKLVSHIKYTKASIQVGAPLVNSNGG